MRADLPACLTAGLEARPSWRIPLDERDIAVRLECDGVTDTVAAHTYGFRDVHDMASEWYGQLHAAQEGDLRTPPRKNLLVEHIRGTAFALPLAICCVVMICFGYSLWGGDLDGSAAAAVAIGVVASFIVTGGIVQAMAWQGLFYAGSGDFRMSAVACRRWTGYGGIILASAAVAALLFNAQFGWLSGELAWLAASFCIAMGALWIGTGILYIVEAPLHVTAATVYGITVVFILHRALGMSLLESQILGVLTAALAAFLTGFLILRKRHTGDASRVYPRMVRQTIFQTAPYLVYGSLYYLLLFADRIVAWTAQTGAAETPVVFRGDYELPHDIALLGFIIGVGWVHSACRSFYDRVGVLLRSCDLEKTQWFNNRMLEFHLRQIAIFLPVAYAVNAIIWFSAQSFGLLATPLTERVALIALAAFPLLTVGLWNVSLLFALSLPWAALPPAICAVLVNLSCGYTLSRIWSYDLAIFGFLAGSAVFCIASSVSVQRRFRRLDYYYLVSGA
ncbi:MAG: hypothetical protein HY821_02060 [Acidobacteria bacterium]|nr:hypothetical protein [Acidobacteriota bacterium]